MKSVLALNEYLKKWFSRLGIDLTFAMGQDFYIDMNNNIVYYSFLAVDDHIEEFTQLCKDLEPDIVTCDVFLLSLFHEIGHHITRDMFTHKEWDEHLDKADELRKVTDVSMKVYYTLPIELAATARGLELMTEYSNSVLELNNSIHRYGEKIMKEFGYTDMLY